MRVQIELKSRYGNYMTIVKDFNNETHQTNWCRMMLRNGHKVIGSQILETK